MTVEHDDRKAQRAARRARKRKGSSFLTHGSDSYDKKGHNRANRQHGRAICREYQ